MDDLAKRLGTWLGGGEEGIWLGGASSREDSFPENKTDFVAWNEGEIDESLVGGPLILLSPRLRDAGGASTMPVAPIPIAIAVQ